MRSAVRDAFTPTRLFHGALDETMRSEQRRSRHPPEKPRPPEVRELFSNLDSTNVLGHKLSGADVDGSHIREKDDAAVNESDDTDIEMDERIAARIEHFRKLPRLIPDIELVFRICVVSMVDCLVGALLTPLKVLVLPHRVDRRDVMTIAFTCWSLAVFYWCALPDSGVLYSSLYHTVRTAATIKLYLLFSILEVSDKLLTSFTSDALEVLYATCRGGRGKLSKAASSSTWAVVAGSAALSLVGVGLHSFVLLLQVVTLNVAVNSEGNSLMALLISNNFVEVKSVVFKKYVPESLFQVCCADALERMQLGIVVVCMVAEHLQSEGFGAIQSSDIIVVVCCELLIDFVKHYFVATFNGVPLSLYRAFSQVVLFDVAADAFLWKMGRSVTVKCTDDPSVTPAQLRRIMSPVETFVSNPSRRCGFVPMPYLAVLLWCALPLVHQLIADSKWVQLLGGLAILVSLKMCTNAYLVGTAQRFVVRSLLATDESSHAHKSNEMDAGAHLLGAAAPRERRATLLPKLDSTAEVSCGSCTTTSSTRGFGTDADSRKELRRAASMPHMGARGKQHTCMHVSKQLLTLLQVERFDLNAGKKPLSKALL